MGALLSEDTLATFHDSLDRVLRKPAFFDRFYELLMTSSPEIAAKFDGIDLAHVKRLVRDSFYVTMMASDGNARAFERLRALAEQHARRAIPKSMHDVWLDALLQAVRELDPRSGPKVEQSWRDVTEIGLRIMKAKAPDG